MSQTLWPLTVARAVERIRARNPTIHAYVTTRLDEALREAERANGRSPRSAIDGVPYGLKDEWDTAGIPTTGGSHRHRGRIPATSSPLFSVLDSAGAILVGKTNLSDMGLAPEATNFIAGATRNPLDPRRTAGGSSGGAAAAVADGMQAFDWGTDIGGSIRLPAAFCGILGMRLSSATWPIQGAFPTPPTSLAWMCGQGPMTRTIAQMRVLLDLTAPALRAGTPRPFFARRAILYPPDRRACWPSFERDVGPLVERLMGAPRLGPDLPSTRVAQKVFVSLWASHLEDLLESDETLSFAAGLRTTIASVLFRGRFGDRGLHPSTGELIALMAIGRYTIFRDRDAPIREATTIRRRFEELWDEGTIVVAPVCVHPTPRVGQTNWNPDLLSCTIPGNLADATAISVPFGTFADGLPRAVQLMGPPGSELVIVDLAERFVGSIQRSA